MRNIVIITSGGDCPGMNAVVVAAVRTAVKAGVQVLGSRFGFDGLIDGSLVPLNYQDIRSWAARGGSFLRTARSKRFTEPEGIRTALSVLKSRKVDGIVVVGGDGSLSGAMALHREGVPVTAVPATIDNDIAGTDYSVGFDTACNCTVRVINDIMDTATALEGRIFLVETLGIPTGFIACASAMAVGADFCLIPEAPFDLNRICAQIRTQVRAGRGYAIGVMSEAVGSAIDFAKEIEARVGERVRPTVIGHAQRGGAPTFFDRALAEALGLAATEALLAGQKGIMASLTDGEVRAVNLEIPLSRKKSIAEMPMRPTRVR